MSAKDALKHPYLRHNSLHISVHHRLNDLQSSFGSSDVVDHSFSKSMDNRRYCNHRNDLRKSSIESLPLPTYPEYISELFVKPEMTPMTLLGPDDINSERTESTESTR